MAWGAESALLFPVATVGLHNLLLVVAATGSEGEEGIVTAIALGSVHGVEVEIVTGIADADNN